MYFDNITDVDVDYFALVYLTYDRIPLVRAAVMKGETPPMHVEYYMAEELETLKSDFTNCVEDNRFVMVQAIAVDKDKNAHLLKEFVKSLHRNVSVMTSTSTTS